MVIIQTEIEYINEAIDNGAKIIISNLKFEGFDKNNVLFIRSERSQKIIIRSCE